MRQLASSSPSWEHRAFTTTRMVLHQILRSAEKRGIAPESLLPSFDYREAPLQLVEHAPLSTVLDLWERSIVRLADRTFPLDVALEAQERPISVLGFLCRASSTPRAAIQTLIRYWGQVTSASFWVLMEHGVRATLELRPLCGAEERTARSGAVPAEKLGSVLAFETGWACQLEFELLDVALGLRAMLAQGSPLRVGVPYEVTPPLVQKLKALRFGLQTSTRTHLIELETELLDIPLRQADPRLAEFLQGQLEHERLPSFPGESLVCQVQMLLASQLERGEPFLERVAAQLKLSRRTLQRQLEESGHTFRELLDQVRQEQAAQLQGRLKAEALAERLGYSDARALRRARRRWAEDLQETSTDEPV